MQRRVLNLLLPANRLVKGQEPVATGAVRHDPDVCYSGSNTKKSVSHEVASAIDNQSITSRIRQELGLSISSAELLACGLVGQVQHLTGCEGSFVYSSTDDNSSNGSEVTSAYESVVSATSEVCMSETSDGDSIRSVLWETIARETATPVDELLPSTSTADAGIDSLLAIIVAGTLSDKLSVKITGTTVMGCETLLDLEVALRKILCNLPTCRKRTRTRCKSLSKLMFHVPSTTMMSLSVMMVPSFGRL